MKYLLFLLLPFFSFAQDLKEKSEPQEKSKVEKFSLKTGSLIKKEFIDLGTVKKVEIKYVKITDMLASTAVSGIKLETKVYKSYGSDTKSCFLDNDEIDGFVKSGKLLMQTLASGKPENYTEFQFTSRGGFQSGAFSDEKGWSYFIKLEKYDGDSYVFMNAEEFTKLVGLIESAKS